MITILLIVQMLLNIQRLLIVHINEWNVLNCPSVVNDHNILNSSNVVNDQIVVNCPNVVKHPTVVNCPYK